MNRIHQILTAACLSLALTACGAYSSGSSSSSNLTPTVSGMWMVTFAPTSSTASSTGLAVNFTQNGNSLTGTVTAVNNSSSSCFSAIASTGTTFNITGQVAAAMQSSSNLSLTVAFTSGSSMGTVTASGSLAYLGTSASGTFSYPAGTSGCTTGSFTMTRTG